jgi:hypothetical protein
MAYNLFIDVMVAPAYPLYPRYSQTSKKKNEIVLQCGYNQLLATICEFTCHFLHLYRHNLENANRPINRYENVAFFIVCVRDFIYRTLFLQAQQKRSKIIN